MTKRILLFVFVSFFLFSSHNYAKNTTVIEDTDINNFFYALMNMASYEKYREFYDAYIDYKDIAYENFRKRLTDGEFRLQGIHNSKLVGWSKKGKKAVVTMDLVFKSSLRPIEEKKRVHLTLREQDGRLVAAAKDIFKMYDIKTKGKKK